jgi:predicted metal-dependent hydrolase
MGTAVPAERDLYQGLIKLAAGCVHRVRGNRRGMTKNLSGARERLAGADEVTASHHGIALDALLADVDAALAALRGDEPLDAIPVPRLR